MEIRRDESMESFLMEQAQQSLGGRRQGIHLTDLMTPRQAYFNKTHYIPPTPEQVGFFTAGRAHEDMMKHMTRLHIGDIIDSHPGETVAETQDGRFFLIHPDGRWTEIVADDRQKEMLKKLRKEEDEWEGIKYNIDLYTNFPVEIKTTRTMATIDEVKTFKKKHDNYIDQLSRYMAIKDSTTGMVWVFYLNHKCHDEPELYFGARSTVPTWRCWWIEKTAEELDRLRLHMRAEKAMLELVLNYQGDFFQLPQCPLWQCGKFIMDKKTKEVIRFKPKCRYFDLCNPNLEGVS